MNNQLTCIQRHKYIDVFHSITFRTLLMASYLGQTTTVAKLINGEHVHPDVTDIQGNGAVIYAVVSLVLY